MTEIEEQPDHTLTPFGDFLAFFAERGESERIWTFIDACSRKGVFHSEAAFCIVAMPVNEAEIRSKNPGLTKPADAWHIVYASGDIHDFFKLAPYELPKLMWSRDGEVRIRTYDYQRVKNLVHKHHGRITKSTTGTTG